MSSPNNLYKSVVPLRNDATTMYSKGRVAPINAEKLYTIIGGKKVLKSSLNQQDDTLQDLGGNPSIGRTLNEKANDYWKPLGGRVQTNIEQLRDGVGKGLVKTVGASAAMATGAAYSTPIVGTLGGLARNIVAGGVGMEGFAMLEGRPATTGELAIGTLFEMGMPIALKGVEKGIASYYANKVKNIPVFRKAPVNLDEKGNIKLTYGESSNRNTTHYTTDIPVQSHADGNWDKELSTIVMPFGKIKNSGKIKTIDPSDLIIEGRNGTVSPKDVHIITGSKDVPNGSKKISSPKLEELYEQIKNQITIESKPNYVGKLNLTRGSRNSKHPSDIVKEYSNEVMRLAKENFKQPTFQQYQQLEKYTGLNSGVKNENAITKIDEALNIHSKRFHNESIPEPKYPNGDLIPLKGNDIAYRKSVENLRNLFYSPNSRIDYNIKQDLINPVSKPFSKEVYNKLQPYFNTRLNSIIGSQLNK